MTEMETVRRTKVEKKLLEQKCKVKKQVGKNLLTELPEIT